MLQEIYLIDDYGNELFETLYSTIMMKNADYILKHITSDDIKSMLKVSPSLIIINDDGLEVKIEQLIKDIKNDPDTKSTPIMVLSSNSSKKYRNHIMSHNVLYFIRKPLESEFLYLAIKNILNLLVLNRGVSPLSGLPGNIQIEKEMKKRFNLESKFAIMYLDLDNFKAYNDLYGFAEGDEIIKYTAKTIQKELLDFKELESPFLGHIGGDDFIAIIKPTNYEELCKKIIATFDKNIKKYFTKEDWEKGYLEVPNRKGIIEQFPITSISIGVVEITKQKFENILEIGEAGAAVKKRAKQIQGSSYYIDKREH